MPIDMTQILLRADGEPFTTDEKSDDQLTLREALIRSLMGNTDKNPPPEEKYSLGKMAIAVYSEDSIDFTPAEIKLLKGLVAETFVNNVLIARVWDALDADTKHLSSV